MIPVPRISFFGFPKKYEKNKFYGNLQYIIKNYSKYKCACSCKATEVLIGEEQLKKC